MSLYYIISPLSGAIIGYFTNWVAIKMLFRPHEEKFLFGRRLPFTPGLIPKERMILSKKVGETISEHLLTDETLTASLCSDEVKAKIETLIDDWLSDIKSSDKTVSEIIFRQDCDKDELKKATDKISKNISVYFMSDTFSGSLKNIEQRLMDSDRRINDFIPEELSANIKKYISQKSCDISNSLINILESSFFEKHVKPLVIGIIEQNVKGLASLFVIPEKVYGNFYEGVIEYLENSDNYDTTAEKLIEVYDKIMTGNIGEIAEALTAGENGERKLLSDLLEKGRAQANPLEQDEAADAPKEIRRIIKEQIADKIAYSLLCLKVGSLFSKVDSKYLLSAKSMIMSQYDSFIKKNIPSLLDALNLQSIIETKINEFRVAEAEEIIISVVDKELKAITYLGGLLGFIIGIIPPVLQSLGIR